MVKRTSSRGPPRSHYARLLLVLLLMFLFLLVSKLRPSQWRHMDGTASIEIRLDANGLTEYVSTPGDAALENFTSSETGIDDSTAEKSASLDGSISGELDAIVALASGSREASSSRVNDSPSSSSGAAKEALLLDSQNDQDQEKGGTSEAGSHEPMLEGEESPFQPRDPAFRDVLEVDSQALPQNGASFSNDADSDDADSIRDNKAFILPRVQSEEPRQGPVSPFRSQKGQDKWLLRTVFNAGNQHRGKGFFLEFGARNGQEESNTFFFEKALGWHGILAEPSPKDQRDIAEVRTNSSVINGAFCQTEGLREYGELQYGLSGIIKSYDGARLKERRWAMKSINITCYRLDRILSLFGVRAIDYMSVDTEGSELDALSSFPFDRVPCRVIGIEVLIGPGREGRTEKTVNFMESRGYKLLHPFRVADDTLDLFFEPKKLPDPSVFARPRVDLNNFFHVRQKCKENLGICL